MRRLPIACVVGAAASVASADILYTVNPGNDNLVRIDTDTMSFTNVGPLGVAFDFGGLAYDGTTMYMVQGFAGNGLYTVDLNTGAASFVGSHGFNDMFGLEYDPSTGNLYGGRSTTGFGLYEIDRSNGSSTFIGNPGVGLDGLSYDSRRDILLGAYAGPGDLYSLDRGNGSATLLYDGDFFNNCGMAYIPSLDEHWMIDWSGNLYSFDPANGYARTLLMNVGTSYDGLVLVPAPGAVGVLALAGLGIVRRRR
jgi:hypothetical protein